MGLVAEDHHRFGRVQGHGPARGGGDGVAARVCGQHGQVDRGPDHGPGLVEAGEEQEVVDQDLHAGRLLFDAAQDGGQVDVVLVGADAEQLGEALYGGQRRAQLVRSVGQELAQALLGRVALGEGVLDLVEHGVEGQAQLAHLARPPGRGHPPGQVASRDRPGRARHLLQGP